MQKNQGKSGQSCLGEKNVVTKLESKKFKIYQLKVNKQVQNCTYFHKRFLLVVNDCSLIPTYVNSN